MKHRQGKVQTADAVLRLGVGQNDVLCQEHIGAVVLQLVNNGVQIALLDAVMVQQARPGQADALLPAAPFLHHPDPGGVQHAEQAVLALRLLRLPAAVLKKCGQILHQMVIILRFDVLFHHPEQPVPLKGHVLGRHQPVVQDGFAVELRENRIHRDDRNDTVQPHRGDDQITDVLDVDHAHRRHHVHDLRKGQQLLHLPLEHIPGGDAVDADDEDAQPVLPFVGDFQESAEVQHQIGHLAVGNGEADALLQPLCGNFRQRKEVGVLVHHVVAQQVADLNAEAVAIEGGVQVDKQRPLQLLPVVKDDAGYPLKFGDQLLGQVVDILPGIADKQLLRHQIDPGAQQVKGEVELLLMNQLGKLALDQSKFPGFSHFLLLQSGEFQGTAMSAQHRQQGGKGQQHAVHIVDAQLLLDAFQTVQVFPNLVPVEKPDGSALIQVAQLVEIQDKQRPNPNGVSVHIVAPFGPVFQRQVVLLQLLCDLLQISEHRVAAHLAAVHQLLHIHRICFIDDAADDELHPLLRGVDVDRPVLSQKGVDAPAHIMREEQSFPPHHLQLGQLCLLQPEVDLAHVIIRRPPGHPQLLGQLVHGEVV